MKAFLAVVGAIVLIGGIVAGGLAIRYYTADPKGKVVAQEQIKSAATRIPAYNHFFDMCAEVQTLEAAIDATLEELARLEPGTDEYVRTSRNLTAQKIARAEAIAQYNADAQKDYTVGQFRASKLPYQLDPTPYPHEGGKTQCVV